MPSCKEFTDISKIKTSKIFLSIKIKKAAPTCGATQFKIEKMFFNV
jgi:hypothetical protein